MDAAQYTSKDWYKVIIFGFISIIPITWTFFADFNPFSLIFLLIGFFPLGYLYRIIKSTFQGSDELPNFDSWKSMFIDGFKVALVLFIYAIPLIIIGSIPIISQLTMTTFSMPTLTIWSFLTGSNISLLLMILIGLIEYLGIANLVLYQGELAAAFRLREIIKRISMIGWIRYLISYLLVWVLGLVLVLILFLSFRIIIGIIIAPLLIIPFYAILTARYLAMLFVSSEA